MGDSASWAHISIEGKKFFSLKKYLITGDVKIDNKKQQLECIEKKLESLRSELEAFPKGTIYITHNGKYTKWYYTDGKKSVLIPKKEVAKAKVLTRKKRIELEIEAYESERQLLLAKSVRHNNAISKLEKFYLDKGYQELLEDNGEEAFVVNDCGRWMNEDYVSNPSHPEGLVHPTVGGRLVRSKAESMIAIALTEAQIPYRYECQLELEGTFVYPDFTIIKPGTRKKVIWEHYGRMDDSGYISKFNYKTALYTRNGYVPGNNLIMSFETRENPLSIIEIKRIIELYLLC